MKKSIMAIAFTSFTVALSGLLHHSDRLLAQYPPQPTGCCKQREWLAGNWRTTDITFEECEQININRDNLDNIYDEKGYVWWDPNCNL